MDSRTPTEDRDESRSGAFEVVKVLARELQAANERIKSLEEARSQADAELELLLQRALAAETRIAEMKNELEESRDKLELLLQRALAAETRDAVLKNELEESRDHANKRDLRMSELQAHSKKVEAALNQERAKVKDAVLLKENAVARLKSRKEEHKVVAGQLCQLKEALAAKERRMEKCEQEKQELLATIHNYEEFEMPWPIDKYFALSDDGRRFRGRPDFISLKPVCAAGVDLRSFIDESRDIRWVTTNHLRLSHPHSLIWISTSCQVGLAFGPMHIYEGSHGWKEHSVFFEQYGKSLEVFFEEKGEVYYAGTYELEHIRHLNPKGCVRSSVECARELSYATINFPSTDPGAKSKTVRQTLQHAVETLYTRGLLKAECAVLRCAGFNHQIHDALSERYQASKILKRKATHSSSVHKRTMGP